MESFQSIPSPTNWQDPTVPRRRKYVSRACGEQPCHHCHAANVECVYSDTRKRRAIRRNRPDAAAAANVAATVRSPVVVDDPANGQPATMATTQTGTQDDQSPETIRAEIAAIMDRVAMLERRATELESPESDMTPKPDRVNLVASKHSFGVDLPPESEDTPYPDSLATSVTEDSCRGGSSSLEAIAALNRILGDEPQQTPPRSTATALARCPFSDTGSFPDCCKADIQRWDPRRKPQGLELMLQVCKIFFSSQNPHCPCLNEAQFLAQMEFYLNRDTTWHNNMDTLQFVALVNLIVAEVKILHEHCASTEETPPGWQEFLRADHLLQHVTWLGRGNLATVQILLIKCTYLQHAEKLNAAYDTIGTAVRLCYQINLHDQNTWHNRTTFDVTMRRRIFWSLFYLDRSVSLMSGLPYLIKDVDVVVDLPRCLDDREFSPSCPAPAENPECSPIPYLRNMIEWGKLSSEIWDNMFSKKAPRPVSQDFIATTDARIVSLSTNLPAGLQWNPDVLASWDTDRHPLYLLRQRIVLHLFINHLRILIRQEELISLQYSQKVAETSLSLAASSVQAIHGYHKSPWRRGVERYSSVVYLTVAIVPLICLIINKTIAVHIRAAATESFKIALAILTDISEGFALARRTLQRLRRLIDAANKVVAIDSDDRNMTDAGGDVGTTELLPNAVEPPTALNLFDETLLLGGDPGMDESSDDFLSGLLTTFASGDSFDYADCNLDDHQYR
ncbi:hypothetical protein FOPE_09304 [Fonsecaea pedrosoi]|nr:hypothetical protein FOPE_09304 [Fonsecaea pedrosoi]